MGLQNLRVWLSSPDTLAQDNPRLTQIGAPQAMSMLLLVNPPFLVPHMEYARDHPSQDPANANAAGKCLSLISSICSLADRGCDG